jgi:holliday junction DNA helicase RuvA
MIAFLEGKFIFKSPANLIVDVNGVGYDVQISLTTYDKIQKMEQGRIFTFLKVSEDAQVLFGFFDEMEKSLFLQLISVSGVGAGTARVMLSGMGTKELAQCIINGQEKMLQAIKGIGAKTAQRIILELRDKLSKQDGFTINLTETKHNKPEQDALNALVSLGIARNIAAEAVSKAIKNNPDVSEVQQLIKLALKNI